MAPSPATPAWDGNAMTQTDMMEKDTVLVLDNKDNVIGSASKRKSHEFEVEQPRGILHRAFSVFIFDESTGKMLLQKRASTKITFPNVRIELRVARVAGRLTQMKQAPASEPYRETQVELFISHLPSSPLNLLFFS